LRLKSFPALSYFHGLRRCKMSSSSVQLPRHKLCRG
jgi:hypothetical protein